MIKVRVAKDGLKMQFAKDRLKMQFAKDRLKMQFAKDRLKPEIEITWHRASGPGDRLKTNVFETSFKFLHESRDL